MLAAKTQPNRNLPSPSARVRFSHAISFQLPCPRNLALHAARPQNGLGLSLCFGETRSCSMPFRSGQMAMTSKA
jgi:hypothetical protein